MTTNRKNHPLSWVETNTSSVIGEVKKREQSQDVSKQLTISRSQRWEPSELVITDAVMEEE